MALQISDQRQTLMANIGAFSPFVTGIGGGSGVTTAVTVERFVRIDGVVAVSASNATAVYCGTTSANAFTLTHNSGDTVIWLAWGRPKV